MFKSATAALVLVLGSATAASALTISNTGSKDFEIGLDQGDKETVHKVPAGKSINFKSECNDGCGVTGPWNYSWMAKTGETISSDGSCATCAPRQGS